MTADLEDRLRRALAERAASTTTSPGARAQIAGRVARHDRRRTFVLRAAAAVVVALLLGGGVAVLKGRGDDAPVTATSRASDDASTRSEASGAASTPSRVRAERSADGSVTVTVDGVLLALPPGFDPRTESVRARMVGTTVFGVVPAATVTVRTSPDAGPVQLFDEPALPGGRVFVADAAPAGRDPWIEARDARGQVLAVGSSRGGGGVMRRFVVGLVIAGLGLGAVAGCSGGGDEQSGRRSATSRAAADEAVAPAPSGAAASRPGDAGDLATIPAGAEPIDGRDVISNATLAVRVRKVGAGASDAAAIVAAGGGALFSETAAFGGRRDATLVFKVPPAAFRSVLGRLQDLGRPVAETVSTEDVTAQVVDLESRLASATASAARLRALFDSANTVGEVVAIESELVKREAEVESLQGQLRVFQAQVRLATITLTLTPLVVAVAQGESETGFAAGLGRGWDALLSVVSAGATALGVLLPFLGLGALGVAITLGVRRRLRLRPRV